MITSILNTIQTKPYSGSRLLQALLLGAAVFTGACSVHTLAHADQGATCAYDPASGQPNPLGNRAFITAIEADGNTQFTYEVFASPIAASRTTTLEIKRTMIFYATGMEDARAQLRENLDIYYELIGYEDIAGFSSYDEAMICR